MTRACADCGDSIPAKRLELLPTTIHCAPCAGDVARRNTAGIARPAVTAKPMELKPDRREVLHGEKLAAQRRKNRQARARAAVAVDAKTQRARADLPAPATLSKKEARRQRKAKAAAARIEHQRKALRDRARKVARP
jgi:hypothetical protein